MIEAFGQGVHDRFSSRIVILHPAADFLKRPTASETQAGFAIDGADFDAR